MTRALFGADQSVSIGPYSYALPGVRIALWGGGLIAFVAGLTSTHPGARLLGYAHTLRYVPLREDVAAADGDALNAQKRAIEQIGTDGVAFAVETMACRAQRLKNLAPMLHVRRQRERGLRVFKSLRAIA